MLLLKLSFRIIQGGDYTAKRPTDPFISRPLSGVPKFKML